MEFLLLSLPEALYAYLGLWIQYLIRSSSLRILPRTMVLVWTLVLLWRAQGRPGGYKAVVGYLGTSLLLLCLFWPEAVPYGRLLERPLAPTQVASYAATQDPGAEVITADDTQQVPPRMRDPLQQAPGFRILYKAITETPLALAKIINDKTHRTFASVLPMQWLLGVDLTADVTTAVADWVHACYLPVLTGTMEGQQGRTTEELLPWDNSILRQGLATRSVIPGAQVGITWMRGPTADNSVPCDTYLDAVEFKAQGWLYELKSPRGTPLSQVFQEELGLESQQQARFLIYREMLKAAGPAVPAPSLAAQYAKLRGASVVGTTLEGGATGWAGGGWIGAAFGALTGAIRGVGGEFQRVVEGLTWLVRIAMVLVWYGPYILGLINLVLIGLFPFVMLWSLSPGTQFEPLAHFFVALLFTSSAPLWWALIDQAATLAAGQAPPRGDRTTLAAITAFLSSGLWVASITALGILLLPVITGLLFFAAFRAVGSLWRGGI
jgi:hypothetical protein